MLNQSERDDLEALLDRYTVQDVLSALEHIAYEKAEHVSTNWQDKVLAKAWRRIGKTLNTTANKIECMAL